MLAISEDTASVCVGHYSIENVNNFNVFLKAAHLLYVDLDSALCDPIHCLIQHSSGCRTWYFVVVCRAEHLVVLFG